MPQSFFILGRGRSGTTLLARLLTQHSEIVVAPEGLFALSLERRFARGPWDAAKIEAFCRELGRERRMRTWHLDLDRVAARLRARAATLDYAGACEQVYLSYAEDTLGRPAPRWLGDKNPTYALFAGRLSHAFPASRFIHVVRDYRHNVRSYRDVPFDLSQPAALAYRWRRYNAEVLALSAAAPERCLRVRFEALAAAPAAELARVCAFLGLAFEPTMLTSSPAGTRVRADAGPGWFQRPIEAVDPARATGTPARPLQPSACRDVDAICAGLGERLGYARPRGDVPELSLAGRAGLALGFASVQAERALFGALPGAWGIGLIGAYRAVSGRI